MKRSEQAMSREVDGEVVILDVASGHYFAINDVGALVWDLLEADTTHEALVDAVTAEFDADRDVVDADVAALVDQLVDAGLVER